MKNTGLLPERAMQFSACRILVEALEVEQTEEMKVTALRALGYLMMNSESNKRKVVEDGGVMVLVDLMSSSNHQTCVQAAMFIQRLFSDDTIHEFATNDLVRVILPLFRKQYYYVKYIITKILSPLPIYFVKNDNYNNSVCVKNKLGECEYITMICNL